MTTNYPLHLSTLGHLRIVWQNKDVTTILPAKAQALLCYLATEKRALPRAQLASLLWGEISDTDARRNLRGILLRIRQTFGDILQSDRRFATLDTPYWLDVAFFEKQSLPASPTQLQQAVDLYQGEFLAGIYVRQAPLFEEWMLMQRANLQARMLTMCHTLTEHYTTTQQYEQGLVVAKRLIQIDPLREDGHRHLMRLWTLQGKRSSALRQYEECRQILAQELDILPTQATTDLYEQIKANQLMPPTSAPTSTIIIPPTTAPELPTNETPFIAGPPILAPHQFFGRERILKRLFHLIKRLPLQNAAIIGPRRAGKTSLLHYLRQITTTPPSNLRPNQTHQWLPQPEQYRWVFVDFQDSRWAEVTPLLTHLLQQMGLTTPAHCTLDDFLDIVSDELAHPTVVLLDEIGVAIDRYPHLDDAFWESLRSLATNQVNGRLGFVLTSAHPPEQLAQQGGLGSPFFNIFGYTTFLGAWTEAEARAFLATSPIPFQADEMAWMLQESQQWPILLQILARECLFAREEGETDQAWQQEGHQQILPFKQALGL